jgi:hypothetical protein
MALTITVSTPYGSIAPSTPGKKKCVEVGSQVNLTAVDGHGPYKWSVTFKGQNPLLYTGDDVTQIAWSVTGRAFGLAYIKVTDSSSKKQEATLELYVGSVVIVGADDSYWQVFSDGTTKPHVGVDSRVTVLVDANAIVADITGSDPQERSSGTPPAEAVTCYMLNLASFAFDSSKKSKKNR